MTKTGMQATKCQDAGCLNGRYWVDTQFVAERELSRLSLNGARFSAKKHLPRQFWLF